MNPAVGVIAVKKEKMEHDKLSEVFAINQPHERFAARAEMPTVTLVGPQHNLYPQLELEKLQFL